jgi:hypothetical protein
MHTYAHQAEAKERRVEELRIRMGKKLKNRLGPIDICLYSSRHTPIDICP